MNTFSTYMAVWFLQGSLLHSVLEHGNFWRYRISSCSVATCLRYGGIFSNYFTANLLQNLAVKVF